MIMIMTMIMIMIMIMIIMIIMIITIIIIIIVIITYSFNSHMLCKRCLLTSTVSTYCSSFINQCCLEKKMNVMGYVNNLYLLMKTKTEKRKLTFTNVYKYTSNLSIEMLVSPYN